MHRIGGRGGSAAAAAAVLLCCLPPCLPYSIVAPRGAPGFAPLLARGRRGSAAAAAGLCAAGREGVGPEAAGLWKRAAWGNRYRVDVAFDGAAFAGWQTWQNSVAQNRTAHYHVQLVLRTVLRAAELELVRDCASVHVRAQTHGTPVHAREYKRRAPARMSHCARSIVPASRCRSVWAGGMRLCAYFRHQRVSCSSPPQISAGRTDAGVHVLSMPCHFDLPLSRTLEPNFLQVSLSSTPTPLTRRDTSAVHSSAWQPW